MNRAKSGFTLAELLVAMVIASMASAVVLRSLAFSLQFYQARTGDTEAQLLCQTVSRLVQYDLTNKSYNPDAKYESTSADADGYGMAPEIAGVTLPKSCYGYGESDQMSRTVKISVTSGGTSYNVTVEVKVAGSAAPIARNTFTVTPLG